MLALESASPASCKISATFIYSIRQNNQPGKNINNPESRSNFQQIVSYCLGLRTQKPGLREVDLESSPKRGSVKINMLKQGRNTLRFNVPNEIPLVLPNGSNYDYHFIIKELANKFGGQFECFGEKTEKYKTFSVPIKKKIEKLIKMVMRT